MLQKFFKIFVISLHRFFVKNIPLVHKPHIYIFSVQFHKCCKNTVLVLFPNLNFLHFFLQFIIKITPLGHKTNIF